MTLRSTQLVAQVLRDGVSEANASQLVLEVVVVTSEPVPPTPDGGLSSQVVVEVGVPTSTPTAATSAAGVAGVLNTAGVRRGALSKVTE
jgi:hypothetical protein